MRVSVDHHHSWFGVNCDYIHISNRSKNKISRKIIVEEDVEKAFIENYLMTSHMMSNIYRYKIKCTYLEERIS